jgi:hypothetical protein
MGGLRDALEGVAFAVFAWTFPAFYAMLTVYLALVSGWGFIIVAVMLAPVFVVWYKVVSEREAKQVEQMLKPYKPLSDEERSRLIESLGKHDEEN